MRILITVLLFICLNAEGQVIRANAYYRPFAPSLLLDIYPNAAAAYSLRKLRSGYTGAAIRVRKDTTGQPELDIGFDANGNLDTVALKSWINLRDAYVTTIYDQTLRLRNLTQTTQTSQPRIALGGIIDRENGKPTMVFDGSNDRIRRVIADSVFRNAPEGSIYFVGKFNAIPSSQRVVVFIGTNSTHFGRAQLANSGTLFNKWALSSRRLDGEPTRAFSGVAAMSTSSLSLITNLYDWANNDAFLYVNNNLDASNLNLWPTPAQNTSNTNSAGISIGDNLDSNTPVNCRISELILFNYVGDRDGISTNINSFYGIY